MYKNNPYYLKKMENNVDFILEHMEGVTKKQLENDPVLQDSMMLRLVQISENAKNLTDDFRKLNNEIPWTDIYGLRNRIVHDYGHIDLQIIYDTLTQDIKEIKDFITHVKLIHLTAGAEKNSPLFAKGCLQENPGITRLFQAPGFWL